MPVDIAQKLADIDALIRAGKLASAKQQLLVIPKKNVGRQKLAAYCQLFRRLRLPLVPLQLLNPIVRGTKGIAMNPTADEKIEYAICLMEVGSPEEALSILQTVDPAKSPRALISQAFVHFSLWNYRASIPLLNRYLEDSELTHYDRLIANVNLLSALVHEKRKMADDLILELLKETEAKYANLHGSVRLYAAEKAITDGDWKDASDHLTKASAIFPNEGSHEHLFIKKWEAILKVSKEKKKASKLLEPVREVALNIGHWETVRDCDRMEALLDKNESLFLKVYFGTPWENYRHWIKTDFNAKTPIPESYLRTMGTGSGTSKPEFDLYSEKDLNEQPLLLRLFAILNRDFYRPIRIASIHTQLYPEEHFNPFSSPNRIHQMVDRLKALLKRKKIHLNIEQDSKGYRLGASKPCSVLVYKSLPKEVKTKDLLADLKALYPNEVLFSAEDASKALKVSSRTLRRFLQNAIDDGSVKREGKRRGAKYKI